MSPTQENVSVQVRVTRNNSAVVVASVGKDQRRRRIRSSSYSAVVLSPCLTDMQRTFLACSLHITADCGTPVTFLLSHLCIVASLHACKPLSKFETCRFRKKGRVIRAMAHGSVAHLHVLEVGMHRNLRCGTHAYNPARS